MNSMTSGELEGCKLWSSLLLLSTCSTMLASMESENNLKAVNNTLSKTNKIFVKNLKYLFKTHETLIARF